MRVPSLAPQARAGLVRPSLLGLYVSTRKGRGVSRRRMPEPIRIPSSSGYSRPSGDVFGASAGVKGEVFGDGCDASKREVADACEVHYAAEWIVLEKASDVVSGVFVFYLR